MACRPHARSCCGPGNCCELCRACQQLTAWCAWCACGCAWGGQLGVGNRGCATQGVVTCECAEGRPWGRVTFWGGVLHTGVGSTRL